MRRRQRGSNPQDAMNIQLAKLRLTYLGAAEEERMLYVKRIAEKSIRVMGKEGRDT
jgi:hypothetical protein